MCEYDDHAAIAATAPDERLRTKVSALPAIDVLRAALVSESVTRSVTSAGAAGPPARTHTLRQGEGRHAGVRPEKLIYSHGITPNHTSGWLPVHGVASPCGSPVAEGLLG